jgi:transcriptional regulator with XRE-family HTH domain
MRPAAAVEIPCLRRNISISAAIARLSCVLLLAMTSFLAALGGNVKQDHYSDGKLSWQGRSMPDTWKQRIQWLLDDQFGGDRARLAEAMGVSTEQVRLYLAGQRPRMDALARLLAERPTISARYLITGTEPRTEPPPDSDLYRVGQQKLARRVAERLARLIDDLRQVDEGIPAWPGGPLRPLPAPEGKREAGGAD